jgi:alanine dehydrogenase
MIVGVLQEIKADENRVSMIPAGVEVMKHHGHTVLVEKDAGASSGFEDANYREYGAEIVETSREIFARAEMIMRVKEPQPSEHELLREGQIYFSYLHLAASEELTRALIGCKSVNIAYETIQKKDGSLPLLIPMSEVAGQWRFRRVQNTWKWPRVVMEFFWGAFRGSIRVWSSLSAVGSLESMPPKKPADWGPKCTFSK